MEDLWEEIGNTLFTDLGWDYMLGVTDTLWVDYDYEGMDVIHSCVVSTLEIMFPPFTREIFNLLGDRWFGVRERVFNNWLYREVSVEMEQFDEYGNDSLFDFEGNIILEDMDDSYDNDKDKEEIVEDVIVKDVAV